jgi:hypothetical protein
VDQLADKHRDRDGGVLMARKSSISFKKRDEADEVYVFPVYQKSATLNTKNTTVMVEYLDGGRVRVIAGNIPGMIRYYVNFPDDDEQKQREQEFSEKLLKEALERLSEYDPETSSSETNAGNRSMKDIYVEVSEEKRDEVVMQMWKVLNWLKDEHIEFMEKHRPDDFRELPALEEEVLRISKRFD